MGSESRCVFSELFNVHKKIETWEEDRKIYQSQ